MDNTAMADVNVAAQLEGIKDRIDRQDILLDRVVGTMEQMAVLAERTANQKDINEKIYTKIEKLDIKTTTNVAQLSKVTGVATGVTISISTLIAIFTILIPLIRDGSL